MIVLNDYNAEDGDAFSIKFDYVPVEIYNVNGERVDEILSESLVLIESLKDFLTGYDNSDGDAYKIYFDEKRRLITDLDGNRVDQTLITDGVLVVAQSFWIECFGADFADIAMRRFEIPYTDEAVKYRF